ncbi:MAG: hypothetical protein AAFV26_00160 [Pseudomonadota bacterium]
MGVQFVERWGLLLAYFKRGYALGAVAVAAVALGGCGLSTVTSGLSGTMFGSNEKKPAVRAVTEDQLLSAAKAEYGPGGVNVGTVAHGCPKFAVEPTGHHMTTYEPGREGDGLAVVHRGEITRTARECQISNGQVVVKYGFSGRVLLGPRGQPGPVTLPVSVVVMDANRSRIAAEEMTVAVEVSADDPIGYFSTVKSVAIPVPQGARPGEFHVMVGFKPKPTASLAPGGIGSRS